MRPARSAPSIAIIVPSHNRHAAIGDCVEACLRQQYDGDFEVIVVDDGSEPPLAPWSDARVRLIRQPQAGPAAARNRGLRATSAERIAFTDDDCRPRPDWLARLSECAPEALAGGHTVNALRENPFSSAAQFLVDFLYRYFDRRPRQRFLTSNNIAAARDRLLAIGGFDETFPLPAAEDRDLCDRWVESGGRLEYAPDAVVDHYHRLGLASFFRQQYRYGRGARALSRRRAARGLTFRPEPRTFYFELLGAPFRSTPAADALRLFGLLLLSQAANVAGFLAEGFRREG
jgi:GT2 family glycosyltransferase